MILIQKIQVLIQILEVFDWLIFSDANDINITALLKADITDIFVINETNYQNVLTALLNNVNSTLIRVMYGLHVLKILMVTALIRRENSKGTTQMPPFTAIHLELLKAGIHPRQPYTAHMLHCLSRPKKQIFFIFLFLNF